MVKGPDMYIPPCARKPAGMLSFKTLSCLKTVLRPVFSVLVLVLVLMVNVLVLVLRPVVLVLVLVLV